MVPVPLNIMIPWKNWKIIQQKPLQWQALCVYYASPMRLVLTGYLRPQRCQMLFNKKMKTDVWALVGIVVTTIQMQQVTH